MPYAALSVGERDAPPEISLELDSPELALAYDRLSDRQFNHGKVLIAALWPRLGERVLDVGCGTGRLGAYVAGLLGPEGSVVGIDPLPLRVRLALGRHERFEALVGRGEQLPFAAASFDAAYLNSVLHWIDDKQQALSELARVLRKGARLAVNSADADRPHQSGQLVRDAMIAEGLYDAAHASALSTHYRVNARALLFLLRTAGFVNVQVRAHTFIDRIDGVDDVFAWSSSSSFGNFLAGLDDRQRARVRARLSRVLATMRGPEGILLERHLVFATAQRP